MICGLSGGVDSAVAAALVHQAIGDQLTCVFVDTGLMRLGEGEQVVETFRRHQGIELIHVEAADRFLERLEGVVDPEEKRKIIGELFIRVFEEAAGGIDGRHASSSRARSTPTSSSRARPRRGQDQEHHNVGGLPEDMDFELVEPLRAPVQGRGPRRSATELGLPDEIVWRQPFPGPGPRRCASSARSRPERVDILQRGRRHRASRRSAAPGSTREIWQAFAVLPAIRSVGVMGDERTYEYPIIVRAVTTRRRHDRRLGPPARRPARAHLAAGSSTRCAGVNRVAYDITSKPPGTIEWE